MSVGSDLKRAVCVVEDTSISGLLNSMQRLSWTGRALPGAIVALLPGLMDREHFRAVERSVFGLIRCSVRPDRVDCLLLGIVPILRFGHPETQSGPDGVTRTWHITGGVQARRAPDLGTLMLAWETEAGDDGRLRHSLFVRVTGYPSRFLPNRPDQRTGWIRRSIAEKYARYHSVVTCRYLLRLARWIEATSEGAAVS